MANFQKPFVCGFFPLYPKQLNYLKNSFHLTEQMLIVVIKPACSRNLCRVRGCFKPVPQ